MTTVRSVGTTLSSGTRTTSTLVAPSSIFDGDKLLALITIGADAGSAPSITAPAGFSEVTGVASGLQIAKADPYAITIRAFVKTASSESGNYAFTHSSALTEGLMYALSSAGDTYLGSVGTGTAVANAVTAPGITTGADNSLVLFLGVAWDGFAPTTPPTGTTPTFTERFDPGVTYIADGVLATAGATGSKTITTSVDASTNTFNVMLVEVRTAGSSQSIAPIATQHLRQMRG